MRHFIRFIYSVSRPRFWLYLAGTFVVGFAAGAQDPERFFEPTFWVYFLFFLVPANFFLYGINDWYDADTDQYNEKKGTREHLLLVSERKLLGYALAGTSLISLGLVLTTPSIAVTSLLILFYALAYFYSAPPLRFKAKPILDSASNILYGLPGFIGYAMSTERLPSLAIVIAVFCWTSAMHLFSAIPDIESDRQAGLTTTAVFLGTQRSLLACFALWLTCTLTIIISPQLYLLGLIGLVYSIIPLYAMTHPTFINKIYWYFPIFNALTGFVLFVTALSNHII